MQLFLGTHPLHALVCSELELGALRVERAIEDGEHTAAHLRDVVTRRQHLCSVSCIMCHTYSMSHMQRVTHAACGTYSVSRIQRVTYVACHT